MPGKLVHIEIPADDTGASRAFWGGVFGWSFEEFPGAPGEYHMARLGEDQGAAITSADPGATGPRAYFDVDDIDAGIGRVRDLGGEAGEKLAVPSMGWFATCRDPHGNGFGLWQTDPGASMG